MITLDDENEQPFINMIPFIDVCLVLLVVFMIAAPLSMGSLMVDLPDTSAPPVKIESKALVVTVQKDGLLRIENEVFTTIESLVSALSSQSKKHEVLYIKADQDARYESVLKAISAAQEAKIKKIGMIGQYRNAL